MATVLCSSTHILLKLFLRLCINFGCALLWRRFLRLVPRIPAGRPQCAGVRGQDSLALGQDYQRFRR